jgi:hypothetical protein
VNSILNGIVKFTNDDIEKTNIMKIISLIDIGRYTNLPNEVDKLQKKKQKFQGSYERGPKQG